MTMTQDMKISLFSQSLFALPLIEAIETTAQIGFPAIELACTAPHFDLQTAREDSQRIAEHIDRTGLKVSALSLFSHFTARARLKIELAAVETFIRLAPQLGTHILKLTPGPPGSANATAEHWHCLEMACARLTPLAEEIGVRLAFETHMRQLTDTLAGSKRLLDIAASDVIGLTVDFSNLAFAGEKMPDVFATCADRIYNTHIKNGTVGEDGSWHFHALDTGLTNYVEVLSLLRDTQYTGYLTIECLGPPAKEKPFETAQRDLHLLMDFLEKVEYTFSGRKRRHI